MVTNDKIMMSSVLEILKTLVFKSSVLIIRQIMLIFCLQENTRGAPCSVCYEANLTFYPLAIKLGKSFIKCQFRVMGQV